MEDEIKFFKLFIYMIFLALLRVGAIALFIIDAIRILFKNGGTHSLINCAIALGILLIFKAPLMNTARKVLELGKKIGEKEDEENNKTNLEK